MKPETQSSPSYALVDENFSLVSAACVAFNGNVSTSVTALLIYGAVETD